MQPTALRTTVTTFAGERRDEVTTYADLRDLAGETAAYADLSAGEREVIDLLSRWHAVKCELAALPIDEADRLRAAAAEARTSSSASTRLRGCSHASAAPAPRATSAGRGRPRIC
jgi:hypothetical protein